MTRPIAETVRVRHDRATRVYLRWFAFRRFLRELTERRER